MIAVNDNMDGRSQSRKGVENGQTDAGGDGRTSIFSQIRILRSERGQGKNHLPCSADHNQNWQPHPVDPCSALYHGNIFIHPVSELYKHLCCRNH